MACLLNYYAKLNTMNSLWYGERFVIILWLQTPKLIDFWQPPNIQQKTAQPPSFRAPPTIYFCHSMGLQPEVVGLNDHPNQDIQMSSNKIANLLAVSGLLLMGASNCVFLVDPGEKALIMNNFTGLRAKVIGEGYHFRIPFVEIPIIYDARFKPIDIHVTTGTKDLQTVTISLRILQQPVAEKLSEIHQLLGKEYEKKVFNSIGQEILRTIVAQYDADQLLKSRETISKEIRAGLYSRAQEFNVNVEDVSFMHLGFSPEYARAIEKKAVQQQLAEKQKFIVLRDEELKTAQIIRSQAQAEAAKLINQAVKTYGATQIEIKKLEAAVNIATLLGKNPNISFVPGNISGNLLNINV